mgnify:CR=1 FL=1
MRMRANEETLLELTPDRKLLSYWIAMRCVPIALASMGVAALAYSLAAFSLRGPLFGVGQFLFCIAVGCVTFVAATAYASHLLRTYQYYVTDSRCAFSGGILLRIRHSVPFHKITDVEQRQNIVQRLFGIWQVGIYTPGTSSAGAGSSGIPRPELVFQGLTDPDLAADVIAEALERYRGSGE